MYTIRNRWSFPKLPSKSRLFLLIIEIIALKDKRIAKKQQNGDRIEGQTKTLLVLKSSKHLQNEWECVMIKLHLFTDLVIESEYKEY